MQHNVATAMLLLNKILSGTICRVWHFVSLLVCSGYAVCGGGFYASWLTDQHVLPTIGMLLFSALETAYGTSSHNAIRRASKNEPCGAHVSATASDLDACRPLMVQMKPKHNITTWMVRWVMRRNVLNNDSRNSNNSINMFQNKDFKEKKKCNDSSNNRHSINM